MIKRYKNKLKILFAGQFTIDRSYGGQGLTFPIMEFLDKYFDAEYTFLVSEKYYEKNIKFAREHDIKIMPFPYPLFFFKNKRLIEAVRNCDVIIDVDGIEFIGDRDFKRRWFHFFRTNYIQWLAERYNKIYLKSTKSYGPFPHKIFRFFVKRSLNKLPFVLARGKENLQKIKELKLDIPVYSAPDVSLSLIPEKKSWAKQYLKNMGLILRKEIIGISPSAIINNGVSVKKANSKNSCGKNHMKLIKEVILFFQRENKHAQILLIPHSITNGQDIRECDLALSKKIYNELGDKKNIFLLSDFNLNYKEARSIIGELDFYITSRYHGLASALFMGIPVVSLAWHIKYRDMMSLFLNKFFAIDCREKNIQKTLNIIKESYNDQSWFNKKEWENGKKEVERQINKSMELLVKEINKKLVK